MADSQRTTTHGREQKQTVKQDISWTIRETDINILLLTTGASLSQKFNKNFGRKANSKVLKITFSVHRVVWRAQDPRQRCKQTTEL